MYDFTHKLNEKNEVVVVQCAPDHYTNISIPTEVNGYPVRHISESAFSLYEDISSVSLPYGLKSIGDKAFFKCSNLSSVIIPNGVTSIGFGAFYGCSNLTSIEMPDSVTSIGDFAFCGCGLKSVTIPNSVTSIEDAAFYGCNELTSITIPDSVVDICDTAFEDCDNLKVVRCNPDSPAEEWARKHGYETEYIMSAQEILNSYNETHSSADEKYYSESFHETGWFSEHPFKTKSSMSEPQQQLLSVDESLESSER